MDIRTELVLRKMTQGDLAEKLGVSRKTVVRMLEGEIADRYLERLDEIFSSAEICNDPPMAKNGKGWKEYTDDEIREICLRRGGFEGLSVHPKKDDSEFLKMARNKETDFQISRSLGLRVWEFNRMLDAYSQRLLK